MSFVRFALCLQSYQPVIREVVVVEHDRTCIRQSGYILVHPCDNFQDIYSDMYTCSLEIKEHEPEKAATEMVQRGGRQTCISGYVCDCHPSCQTTSVKWTHCTTYSSDCLGKDLLIRGDFKCTSADLPKVTNTNFPSFLSIFFSSSICLAEQNGGLQKWKPLSQSPEPQR